MIFIKLNAGGSISQIEFDSSSAIDPAYIITHDGKISRASLVRITDDFADAQQADVLARLKEQGRAELERITNSLKK